MWASPPRAPPQALKPSPRHQRAGCMWRRRKAAAAVRSRCRSRCTHHSSDALTNLSAVPLVPGNGLLHVVVDGHGESASVSVLSQTISTAEKIHGPGKDPHAARPRHFGDSGGVMRFLSRTPMNHQVWQRLDSMELWSDMPCLVVKQTPRC